MDMDMHSLISSGKCKWHKVEQTESQVLSFLMQDIILESQYLCVALEMSLGHWLLCCDARAICCPAGMDVITSIATIPTYKPAERIRLFNGFAQLIGDGRAQTARAMWDRPLKTVYISNCGELTVTKPSLSPPSLP
jgi:hypothetical protein